MLESEGASFLLATCPSSQRQIHYPSPIASIYYYARFGHLALPLLYELHAIATLKKRSNLLMSKSQKVGRESSVVQRRGVKIWIFFSGLCMLFSLPVIFITWTSHRGSEQADSTETG